MAYLRGLTAKAKHAKAPSFVVCRLLIKRDDLIASLQQQKEEWINIDIKTSQDDPTKLNTIINEWKPDGGISNVPKLPMQTPTESSNMVDGDVVDDYPEEEINPDEIPF